MIGTILNSKRRQVIVISAGQVFESLIERKYDNLIPGDRVEFDLIEDHVEIKNVLPRSNTLHRAYFDKSKEIVANLDELWLVAAPPPLLNFTVIDRTLCLANLLNIKTIIVLNKKDLGTSECESIIKYYEQLPNEVLVVSAKTAEDIELLKNRLRNKSNVALCGVSGVGKSTILKRLLPGTEIRTQEVSEKTGQGKQTTSNVMGYTFQAAENDCLIFDLPGIQNFGLSHLDRTQVRFGFKEFMSSSKCKFQNCLHLEEPGCAVKAEVAKKNIIESRYQSYCQIIKEIDLAKPY